MAGAWPGRAGDPFADWMNSVQKYVVSDTLTDADLTWEPTRRSSAAPIWSRRPRSARPRGRSERHGQRHARAVAARGRPRRRAEPDDRARSCSAAASGIFPDDGEARPFELRVDDAGTGVQVCRYQPTGETLRTGDSDELFEDPDAPPVKPA